MVTALSALARAAAATAAAASAAARARVLLARPGGGASRGAAGAAGGVGEAGGPGEAGGVGEVGEADGAELPEHVADEDEIEAKRMAARMAKVMGGVSMSTLKQERDAGIEALVAARVRLRSDRDGTLPAAALTALLAERDSGAAVGDLAARYDVDEETLRTALLHVCYIRPVVIERVENEALPPMR